MRHIGIIGAMEEEVAILKEKMTDVTVEKKASMEFYSGRLNGKEAVIVRSGIGKVNAGICTQILADDFHVDAVINTGVAGSLRAEINIGDIVLSTEPCSMIWTPGSSAIPSARCPEWIRWHSRQMRLCAAWQRRYAVRSIPISRYLRAV